MHRRRTLCLVAALGALAVTAGPSQASTGWTAAPATTVSGPINSFSDTDAWALGAGGFEHWNGNSWTQFAMPTGPAPVFLEALADDGPTDAWAVGFALTGYASGVAQIEHWNGSAWSTSPVSVTSQGLATLNAVVSLGPSNAWAVGSDGHTALVEHWNGTGWSRVSVPSPNGSSGSSLSAISVSPSGDIWAAGDYVNPSAQPNLLYALHYDGTAWHLVTMAQTGSQNSFDNPLASGVVAIAPNDVWMVGSHESNGDTPETLTEHWDGAAWSIVPSPFDQAQDTSTTEQYSALTTLTARASNDVWAGGYYFTYTSGDASGVYHALLVHWNGTSWTQDTSAPTTGTNNKIQGISTTLGGHVIWATNSGSPPLLEHP